ncbi:hypothetical protein ACOMHN_037837 [Nucella lapillus]
MKVSARVSIAVPPTVLHEAKGPTAVHYMVDSQTTTDLPCLRYNLETQVLPRTAYEFQGTQLVLVLRHNFTLKACKDSCLADDLCGGLIHDSRTVLVRITPSINGLCVLVPRKTLEQEREMEASQNTSSAAYQPPVGVASFAKACIVNNLLYIYGGVAICVGTFLTVLAAFLYRKDPARLDKEAVDPNNKVTLDIDMKDLFKSKDGGRKKKKKKKKKKKPRQSSFPGSDSTSSIMAKLFAKNKNKKLSGTSLETQSSKGSHTERDADTSSAVNRSVAGSVTGSSVFDTTSEASYYASGVSGMDWPMDRSVDDGSVADSEVHTSPVGTGPQSAYPEESSSVSNQVIAYTYLETMA